MKGERTILKLVAFISNEVLTNILASKPMLYAAVAKLKERLCNIPFSRASRPSGGIKIAFLIEFRPRVR